MQTLKHDDTQKEYDLPSIFKDKDVTPVVVEIADNKENILVIIGDTPPLEITVQQARDFALALRQVANRMEGEERERQWVK